jgi:hypothetical protein
MVYFNMKMSFVHGEQDQFMFSRFPENMPSRTYFLLPKHGSIDSVAFRLVNLSNAACHDNYFVGLSVSVSIDIIHIQGINFQQFGQKVIYAFLLQRRNTKLRPKQFVCWLRAMLPYEYVHAMKDTLHWRAEKKELTGHTGEEENRI